MYVQKILIVEAITDLQRNSRIPRISIRISFSVLEEKQIPDPTGKLLVNYEKFDSIVFKYSSSWAKGLDVFNRVMLEPSFEAIVDAGKLVLQISCIRLLVLQLINL